VGAAYETVRYEVADGVATISMDQPDSRNALSDALLDDLLAAFEEARGTATCAASCSPRRTRRPSARAAT
jgi:enoyl-CoA hydratase/carnithine racemase